MASFSVTIEGLDQLKEALAKSPETVVTRLHQAVVDSAAKTVEIARRSGELPWKTGRLNASFTLKDLTTLQATVGPTVNYAVYVHEGTAPHTIYPVNGKALFWPGAAHPVKKVNHPGNRANPFMPRILDASKGDILSIFSKAMDQITSDIAS
jgi:hypothetical protein